MKGLERLECKGLLFDTRPGTSDEKAIKEVVEKSSYGRHGFTPGSGENWVDLGANVGAFSVWAASQHPSIQVTAYEPDPVMCELIERNARINKLHSQITITQAAVVADRRKSVELNCNVARGNVWRNSIERHWRGEEIITVPAIHINKVLTRNVKAWVKMDVEGTEKPLLTWLLAKPEYLPVGMVFEWSFDVWPAIADFDAIVEGLNDHYGFVTGTNLGKIQQLEEWPAAAFPPCRLIYVYDPK